MLARSCELIPGSGRNSQDQGGLILGEGTERVNPRKEQSNFPQPFVQFSPKRKLLPESSGCGQACSNRSPNERNAKKRNKTWRPEVAKGYMMHEVEVDLIAQALAGKVNACLPEIVVEVKTPLTFFEEAHPARQIKINPMNVRRMCSQDFLNRLLIIGPGDDPYLVPAGNLQNPVPTNRLLRALAGLAGIR
ncbi:MAG: hypothetical protein ABR923_06870 [Terracidiphilus sp.]